MTQLFNFTKQYPAGAPDQETAAKIVQLAKAINAGTSANYASKAKWYEVIKRLAEQDRQPGDSEHQAFAKFIQTETGSELFRAYKNAGGPDFQPVPAAVAVIKNDSAYSKLKKIAAELRAGDPSLSEGSAFMRAYTENPALADASKHEQVFA